MEKFEKDLEEIKTKYNNIKLTDEEKNDLKMKMQEELNKSKVKEKNKTIIFPRRLVATFACFFLIIVSCAAFADEIEDFVKHVFSNTDKEVELAIENGNYEKINMDYKESNGISIKIDYVVEHDDRMYIAFNVFTKDKYKKIYIKDAEIKNGKGKLLFAYNGIDNIVDMIFYDKYISNDNFIIIYKLKDIEKTSENEDIKIKINKIYVENENKNYDIELENCEFSI